MNYLDHAHAIATMNTLGENKSPFLFVIDYKASKALVIPLDEIDNDLRFEFPSTIQERERQAKPEFQFKKSPLSILEYQKSYDKAIEEINYGNSYLLNLTCSTGIECNLSLEEIYDHASSRYKLLLPGEFVLFSPETFVKIENGKIYSYPMKGTIDASIPGAKQWILQDSKEYAEHVTIVDLIRNDLSIVSSNVSVDEFRYVEEVHTHEKTLLQVSSKISGDLPDNHLSELGSIIFKLLPAGSITGAPKKKTIEIIDNIEQHKRRFFTGVAGVFDGENLDSAVMIRFIENQNGQMVFKSGGGITSQSDLAKEYQEMIDKVYVPIN